MSFPTDMGGPGVDEMSKRARGVAPLGPGP